MLFQKNICSNCLTGKMMYQLDTHSDSCIHISCLKGNKCAFYVPIERKKTIREKVSGIFKK